MGNHIVSREHARKHIDKRLRIRLRLYFLIAAIMVGIVIFNWAIGKLSLIFSLLGIGGGLIIGIVSSRMFHISWDHDAQKVVSQFDLFGGIILAGYIVFEISREWLFSQYIHGAIAGAITFAFIAGVMIGRVLGTRGKIRQVLKEQKVFIR